jgi:hypothetical protein
VSVIDRAGEAGDQRGILEAAIAMVEPVDLEQVERLLDIFGRTFLAGMGDALEAHRCGGGEDALELRGRMADFGRIEAHAGDPVDPGLGLGQRLERVFLVEVAQEAEDQLRGDVQPFLGLGHAGEQAVGSHAEGDAAMRVRLRIEEDLGMDDAVLRHTRDR